MRPILTMSANSSAFAASASRSRVTDGTNSWTTSSAAAMCMAVGKVSFDDCDMFTSSFGWMGDLLPRSPPASSMARLEITSLTFMLVCVPLPVCHTNNGNSSPCAPAITSSAASTISAAFSGTSFPSSWFTSAAAFLSTAIDRITASGMRSVPMEKWWSDRWVWAPQYRSLGTSIGPMLSVSVRVVMNGSRRRRALGR